MTSPVGAVWRDINNVLRRRYPLVELVLSPTVRQAPALLGETLDLRELYFDRVRMGLKRGAIFIEDHGCPPLQILKMRTLLDARRPDDHRVRT